MVLPGLPEWVRVCERFSPLLLDLGMRSVVIIGVAGVIAAGLRRASAAVRHWVWLMGFTGMLLLPVLAALLPAWHVMPRLGHEEPPAAAVEFALPSPPMTDEQSPAAVTTPTPARQDATRATPSPEPAPAAAPPQTTTTPEPKAPPARIEIKAEKRPGAASIALPWTFWIVIAWASGTLMTSGYVVLGHASLWWLQRRCRRLCGQEWERLLQELRGLLNVRRRVELLTSPVRTMPMTWGLWRTRLLVPAVAQAWPTEQRRAVVLHELGHVRRWDCVTQLAAQMACAIYWFNPLVWVAWRRMQIERERACDDLVLQTGAKGSVYAQHLLHSATAVPVRFIGAAVAMARPSTLEERLRAILDSRRNRRTMTMKSILGTTLLLVTVVVPMACLQAQETPTTGAPTNIERAAVRASAVTGETADVPATRSSTTTVERPPVTTSAPGRGGGSVLTRGFSRAAPPSSPEGPTSTFDATIYDVRIPADQIGLLDLNALTRSAASPAEFEKALAALGAIAPLCRVSQSVRLEQDSVNVGTQTPYIQSSTNTARGVVNVPNWYQTGTSFSMAGKPTGINRIDLNLQIQVSTLSESSVAVQENLRAPAFRSASMSYKGLVTPREPFVILSVDGSTKDGNGKAVAFIARVTLGQPQGGTSQGGTTQGGGSQGVHDGITPGLR